MSKIQERRRQKAVWAVIIGLIAFTVFCELATAVYRNMTHAAHKPAAVHQDGSK